MILKSRDDAELGILLVGYEFETASDFFAVNRLEIKLSVRNGEGYGWSQTPCILTWEVAALAAWLRDRGQNQPLNSPTDEYLVFQEPNLQLQFGGQSPKGIVLAVTYNLERPGQWVLSGRSEYTHTWSGTMRLTVPQDELRIAAGDLEQQLQGFPIRKDMAPM